MSNTFVLLLMIFLHIVDDYYLQGWLASAKQKEWWQNNAPQKLYKNDYIWALIMHSFSWSFMIMLPLAFKLDFNIGFVYVVMLLYNLTIHALIDNLKANKKAINLWQDQIVHLIQIVITFLILI